MRLILTALFVLCASLAQAAMPSFTFPSIDGGEIDLAEWRGQPLLVVNTASSCGYTPQYDGLQELFDTYRDRGLVVLAVPSNDFRQELASDEAVKDFCEVNFDLDIPMTTITRVIGAEAHPFYKWLEVEAGFTPRWNFNKVLIAPDGSVAATFGSNARPLSRPVTEAITALLD
ncbi:glutathione peroxidase [Marivita geojedonensis]|uniref:Glutathione peroxidase n=1 Tax=Marivita geojedonensis TaxID=1123756 RepID=A0A1X4NI12_9RHOB|nr:glutathione peroxidase [Marivita geojedonensis]OSQ47308.1 glutathione peroxidase [Marivita geojedonensis]PRY76442.1 glutathione peroxidase [Marivita geojedonensis]